MTTPRPDERRRILDEAIVKVGSRKCAELEPFHRAVNLGLDAALEELSALRDAAPSAAPEPPTHCHCGFVFPPDFDAEQRAMSLAQCKAKPAPAPSAPPQEPLLEPTPMEPPSQADIEARKHAKELIAICMDCDGCGWVEGGSALQTQCKTCKGTGVERECLACHHPAEFHNAAGCGIDQCGCLIDLTESAEEEPTEAQQLMNDTADTLARLERQSEPSGIYTVRGRRVRVCQKPDGSTVRHYRGNVAVRDVETNRLSYVSESDLEAMPTSAPVAADPPFRLPDDVLTDEALTEQWVAGADMSDGRVRLERFRAVVHSHRMLHKHLASLLPSAGTGKAGQK